VFLFIVTVLLHSGVLHNGFALDDYAAIVENPNVTAEDPADGLTKVFTSNFWGDRKRFEHVTTWRPLTTLTFRAIHSVAGAQPWAFHAASLLLHGLVTMLVFWLAFRWFDRMAVAVVAGGLFAVMPVHVEVIAGAVNCAELQAATLYLAALLGYLVASTSTGVRRVVWLLGALLLFSLALLSKEHAVTWPVALFLIEGSRRLRFKQKPTKHSWVRLPPVWFMAGIVVIIGVYLWARSSVLPALLGGDIPASDNPMVHATIGERFLTIGKLYFRYIELLVAPTILTADYTIPAFPVVESLADADAFAGLILCALTLAAVVGALRRSPDVAGALLLFLMMASLVGNVFFLNTIIVAERLMYLPSVGWCCAVALVVVAVWDTARWNRLARVALPAFMVIIAAAYGWRSWDRVPDWKNNWTLFASAVEEDAVSARSQYIYAAECFDRGRIEEARSHVLESVRMNPDNPAGHELLGDIYWQQRNGQLARKAYQASFSAQSTSGVLVKLCRSTVQSGHVQMAVKPCALAARAVPSNPMAHHFYGLALMYSGQLEDALNALTTALRLEPENTFIQKDVDRLQSQLKAAAEQAQP